MAPLTSRSIFGTDPVDEFASGIADWIWENSQGHEALEIEAKTVSYTHLTLPTILLV